MLNIDTEGFDPLVLHGASKTLAGHKVDLLLFEYNYVGLWGTGSFTLKVSITGMFALMLGNVAVSKRLRRGLGKGGHDMQVHNGAALVIPRC